MSNPTASSSMAKQLEWHQDYKIQTFNHQFYKPEEQNSRKQLPAEAQDKKAHQTQV